MIFLVIIIAAIAVSVKKKRNEESAPIRASEFSKAAVATDRKVTSLFNTLKTAFIAEKIRTRKKSIFGHFSHSGSDES